MHWIACRKYTNVALSRTPEIVGIDGSDSTGRSQGGEMNFQVCEKEHAIIEASQQGALTPELLVHVGHCQVCREVLSVSEVLQAEAVSLDKNLRPPDALLIWHRAQQKARQDAIAKATLPIRIAIVCAVIVAIAFLPWLASYVKELSLKVSVLKSVPSLNTNWLAIFSGTNGLALAAAFIFIGLSSWFVLWEK
jgi:hypothetical protein